ncbi:hypothetical protein BGZ49_008147 [Haplosporangium sp. Z 27]|nr:hypothetical protein BGZ49_008147 [Haplosporangium sp. Z 27]
MNTLRLGQTLYHNCLTTLEIVGMGDTWSFPSESLHEFLCSSPQLLHLKAPNTVYYLEYFIMTDIDDFNKHPQPYQSENNVPSDNALERDPDQGAKIRVWACQNLQTLHLEFCGRYGDDFLPMRSRIMFAYIAKVCPKIQDLQIRRCFLDLSLEGGWCFLSQLKELSRLRIETGVLRYITENDLAWIGNPDTVSTWQRAKYQLIARQLRKKHSAERSNSGAYVSPVRRSDTDLIVDELRSSSGLDRVADILQTKSGSNIKVCWPGLEFLELTYSNQRDCIPIAAYIRSIRPDLDLGVSQIKYK